MSDFYLLDTFGSCKAVALHSESEVVAYDAGCMIIVWNMRSDSKICLQKHEHEVIHIQFLQTQNRLSEMLLSIDMSGLACLWDLDTASVTQIINIANTQMPMDRPLGLAQILSASNNTPYFCFAERDEEGPSYKVSVWTIERGQLTMKAKSKEFTDEKLKGICMLPQFDEPGIHKQENDDFLKPKPMVSFKFVTVEEKCVKIWKYEDEIMTTYRKINIKYNLEDVSTSEMKGFIFVLSSNGKVLILDSEGEYVTSLQRSDIEFSSISCSYENLYLGTTNGTVHCYNVMTLISSSKKQISYTDLLKPFEMKSREQEDIEMKFTGKVSNIRSSK